MPLTKQCKDCGEHKQLDEFHKSPTEKYGVRSRCKPCRHKHNKETGVYEKTNRDYNLRKYGITWDEVVEMYANQDGCCAICKTNITIKKDKENKKRTACVDHNHKTGDIRGLLCMNCNKGIGSLQDSISILESAIEYLESNGSYGD